MGLSASRWWTTKREHGSMHCLVPELRRTICPMGVHTKLWQWCQFEQPIGWQWCSHGHTWRGGSRMRTWAQCENGSSSEARKQNTAWLVIIIHASNGYSRTTMMPRQRASVLDEIEISLVTQKSSAKWQESAFLPNTASSKYASMIAPSNSWQKKGSTLCYTRCARHTLRNLGKWAKTGTLRRGVRHLSAAEGRLHRLSQTTNQYPTKTTETKARQGRCETQCWVLIGRWKQTRVLL